VVQEGVVNPIGEWLESSTPLNPPARAKSLPVPAEVVAAENCDDPNCIRCSSDGPGAVAEAGARAICSQVGLDYDDLDTHEREHYKHIAGAVYGAMSEAMLLVGIAHEVTT
jgi:hypothetical protein